MLSAFAGCFTTPNKSTRTRASAKVVRENIRIARNLLLFGSLLYLFRLAPPIVPGFFGATSGQREEHSLSFQNVSFATWQTVPTVSSTGRPSSSNALSLEVRKYSVRVIFQQLGFILKRCGKGHK